VNSVEYIVSNDDRQRRCDEREYVSTGS